MNKNVTTFFVALILVFFSIQTFGQAPLITKEPSSRGVIVGQKATFTVQASGDTLEYQWYLNGFPIGGANDSSYTTPTTTLLMNGSEFQVIVSNSHGSDASQTVKLYVTAVGSRVTGSQLVLYNFKERSGNQIKDVAGYPNPLNLTITNGSSVDWSNNGLFVKDGALINSTSLTASGRVVDSIRFNNEMSVEMWIRPLTTGTGRIIDLTTSPSNVNFGIENYNGYNFLCRTTTTSALGNPGATDNLSLSTDLIHLTFTHSAEGVSKIYRNGVEVASETIPGNLSNWVYLTKLSLGSFLNGTVPWKGIYYLAAIYYRSLDSVEVAHNFSLGYNGINAPFIIEEPKDTTLQEGYTVVLNSRAVGEATLNYQWQKNGVNIAGATDSIYSILSATFADSGSVYRVIVTNTFGSDTSDNAVVKVFRSVKTPGNLTALANSAGRVELAWHDSSNNETGFIIERKHGAGSFAVIDSTAANSTAYSDFNVVDTTNYTYRVKAFNLFTQSGYSNEASVTTLLSTIAAPTNLVAVLNTKDSTRVNLSWNDNSSNESGFVIQRALGDSTQPFSNIDTVAAGVTTHTDSITSPSTTYTYRVYAYNADTVSAFSNFAKITTAVPVELTTFTANTTNGKVLICWETATEINNAGFSLQRSENNLQFAEIAFIRGKGTTTEKTNYNYSDKSALSGKYYYRLKQIDFNGTFEYSKSIEVDLGIPKEFALEQNYPNPFNPSTTIRFTLPMKAKVEVKVYNTLGQEVASILNNEFEAGIHEINFDASNLSSGVYFYMLKAQGADASTFTFTKRMILMK
ncbi:MAG TPA: T9SS type A sorting domain-containing protein [Ignavibacteriaceae bacterium]|nr:T9SS type A sorting domain-containing protein [Ignavibacteriaceae bacterium]